MSFFENRANSDPLQPVVCLELGIGRDSDFRLRATLARLELNVEDITKNAVSLPSSPFLYRFVPNLVFSDSR